MQEDFIPQSFDERVTSGLAPKTRKVISKIKEKRDPMRDLNAAPKDSANPTALPGTGTFGSVSVGMHRNW